MQTFRTKTVIRIRAGESDSNSNVLDLNLGLTAEQKEFARANTQWKRVFYYDPCELMEIIID